MEESMDAENAAFWLPTHFLTDDDFLTHPNPKKTNGFGFGFDSFCGSLDSPVSSTETDKAEEINNEDDEFLAELTRHLAHSTLHDNHHRTTTTTPEKAWMFSTSPQSTLTGFGPWSNRSGFSSNGSPSQVPSPPLTPEVKNDAAWDLLYEAAGQVAILKMNAIAAHLNQQQQSNRGLLSAPRQPPPKYFDYNNQYDVAVKRQGMWAQGRQEREEWYCHQTRRGCGGGGGGDMSAWPALRGQGQNNNHHNHHQQQQRQQQNGGGGGGAQRMYVGGTGVGPMKRQSTGTGVFLPRRVGTSPPRQHHHHHQTTHDQLPRKRPTGCSNVLLPARGVLNSLTLDFEDANNASYRSRFGAGFPTDHDIMVARRNAMLGQQRRSSSIRGDNSGTMVGHEVRLPSDWTY